MGSALVEKFGLLEPILRFRFLVFLAVVGLLWMVLGNRRFLVFFGYVIAYPFVVAFWHAPRILFRNWAVVIAFSPAVHAILTTFRTSFLLFSISLISAFVVCLAEDPRLVIGAMSALAAYLAFHYIRRFRVAFSPSTVFADLGGVVRTIWESFKDSDFTKLPDSLSPDSDEYQAKIGANLMNLYLMSSSLYFLGERLREVVNSRKLDLYFLGSLLYTFALTAVIFGIEYLGLERIRPGSFQGIDDPGLFDFIGLSFSTLMTSDISPLHAATGAAQIASYLQLFGSLLIIVLLVFVILTSIRERYKQDLDNVVEELARTSEAAAAIFESTYELSISAAETRLLEIQNPLMKMILRLRHGKERAQEIIDSFDGAA